MISGMSVEDFRHQLVANERAFIRWGPVEQKI
jgi:hypothetical protein